MTHLTQYIYIISAALFILSLKWMNHPASSRRGVIAGGTGMVLAILGTFIGFPGVDGVGIGFVHNWPWIITAFVIDTVVGVPIAYIMPMTAVPQRRCPTPVARLPRRWSARPSFISGSRTPTPNCARSSW